MPKKYGDNRLAIKLYSNYMTEIGTINESCDNFEIGKSGYMYKQEIFWLIKTLSLIYNII
jgi:hypothetical protein